MSQVQFMHYRKFTQNGVVDSCGGATVAILPVTGTNEAMVAVARCNPSDLFDRKVGRTIAEGRIHAYLQGRVSLEGQVKTVVVNDMLRLKETVNEVLHQEMDANDLY